MPRDIGRARRALREELLTRGLTAADLAEMARARDETLEASTISDFLSGAHDWPQGKSRAKIARLLDKPVLWLDDVADGVEEAPEDIDQQWADLTHGEDPELVRLAFSAAQGVIHSKRRR